MTQGTKEKCEGCTSYSGYPCHSKVEAGIFGRGKTLYFGCRKEAELAYGDHKSEYSIGNTYEEHGPLIDHGGVLYREQRLK